MQIKNPTSGKWIVSRWSDFLILCQSLRYDSIRDYHVMNVRDLDFVMAAAGGFIADKKLAPVILWRQLMFTCLEKSFSEYILVRSLSLPACFPHILTDR